MWKQAGGAKQRCRRVFPGGGCVVLLGKICVQEEAGAAVVLQQRKKHQRSQVCLVLKQEDFWAAEDRVRAAHQGEVCNDG